MELELLNNYSKSQIYKQNKTNYKIKKTLINIKKNKNSPIESTFYKFLDYDNHIFGTHQKIYSWVKVKSKYYDCHLDPNPEIKKEIKVFPDDVTWKARYIKDVADELKIIY